MFVCGPRISPASCLHAAQHADRTPGPGSSSVTSISHGDRSEPRILPTRYAGGKFAAPFGLPAHRRATPAADLCARRPARWNRQSTHPDSAHHDSSALPGLVATPTRCHLTAVLVPPAASAAIIRYLYAT